MAAKKTATKPDTVYFISQAHIDPSWLWPKSEIACDVAPNRTFAPSMDLLNEHADLYYAQSASILYKWTETHAPEVFDRIKAAVAGGRWEIVGGAVVEHSTNPLCAESLVRQHLQGKRYFMETFGVDVKTAWHPDTFGFTWALPQIYAKSGIENFMTGKLDWEHERNDPAVPWPYNVFWWEGADGSRVLAQQLPCWGYDADLIRERFARFKKRHGFGQMMGLFGAGDHGGGPREAELVKIRALNKKKNFPKTVFGSVRGYYELLREQDKRKKLPTVNDELYLKTHRGCLTTDAQVKRDNRHCETLLLNAERFSLAAADLGQPYPKRRLDDLWELLLYGQVHDNIDGASIQRVYDEAHEDYQHLYRKGGTILDNALSTIAGRIDTSDVNGLSLILFNPNPWPRTDIAHVPMGRLRIFDRLAIHDEKGNAVPWQLETIGGVEHAAFHATLPPLGYARYTAARDRRRGKGLKPLVRQSGNTVENQYLRVTIDPQTGCLTSVYDKKNRRETLAKGGLSNVIEIYGDQPDNAPGGEPAWNINLRERHDLTSVVSVKSIAFGPVAAGFRVTRTFGDSRFVQEIKLYDGQPFVHCTAEVDWHELYTTMKVAFHVSAKCPYATYETAFGATQRYDFNLKKDPGVRLKFPNRKWEPADRAKFECAALKWIDLTDRSGKHGVSLLNDSKHGFVVEGSTMRMTCIRGTRRAYETFTDEWTDQSDNPVVGLHRFAYALYPHAGDWRTAGSIRRGEEFNAPILSVIEEPHDGDLGSSASFVSVDGDGIILTALKKAEDSNAWIIRLFESRGSKTVKAAVTFERKVTSATETDLIEWDQYVKPKKVGVRGCTISLTFAPHEIKTVRVAF